MNKLSHPFFTELKRYVASQNATLGPIILSICDSIKYEGTLNIDETINEQRKLSQVADMIHAAHVFHRCARDDTLETKRLHQENIMSILVGDYLLAQSSMDIATLNPMTVGLMAKSLEDYTRGEFLRNSDLEKRAASTRGSLLSNSCLSAALLAGHSYTNDPHELTSLVRDFGLRTGSASRLLEI